MNDDITNSDKMNRYAEIIFETNQKFNLTGHKHLEQIKEDLIDNTLSDCNPQLVPRGTSFIDIGTGSGIPGIVIALGNPDVSGTLVEANSKKVNFLKEVVSELNLKNVSVVCARAEDYCRENREVFDLCVTRAFGPVYYSIEFAMPVLKIGGMLCVFSKKSAFDLSGEMLMHLENCGGSLSPEREEKGYKFFASEKHGITLYKTRISEVKYPRRFPVIKRDAAKIPEFKTE